MVKKGRQENKFQRISMFLKLKKKYKRKWKQGRKRREKL